MMKRVLSSQLRAASSWKERKMNPAPEGGIFGKGWDNHSLEVVFRSIIKRPHIREMLKNHYAWATDEMTLARVKEVGDNCDIVQLQMQADISDPHRVLKQFSIMDAPVIDIDGKHISLNGGPVYYDDDGTKIAIIDQGPVEIMAKEILWTLGYSTAASPEPKDARKFLEDIYGDVECTCDFTADEMSKRVFLSVAEAARSEGARFVDVRWSLTDLSLGKKQYETSRIPGAVFFDLEELSGKITEESGRHPLPEFKVFKAWLVRHGLGPDQKIITYDGVSGGSAAARAWWMLTTLGYPDVSILETGFKGWTEAGHKQEEGAVSAKMGLTDNFATPQESWDAYTVDIASIKKNLAENVPMKIIDARSAARYESTTEPSFPDKQPGHIPTAVNHPFMANFTDTANLVPEEILSGLCKKSLGDTSANDSIVYCGSGVTACTTAAAIQHAGFGLPKIYVGSWSEWSKHLNMSEKYRYRDREDRRDREREREREDEEKKTKPKPLGKKSTTRVPQENLIPPLFDVKDLAPEDRIAQNTCSKKWPFDTGLVGLRDPIVKGSFHIIGVNYSKYENAKVVPKVIKSFHDAVSQDIVSEVGGGTRSEDVLLRIAPGTIDNVVLHYHQESNGIVPPEKSPNLVDATWRMKVDYVVKARDVQSQQQIAMGMYNALQSRYNIAVKTSAAYVRYLDPTADVVKVEIVPAKKHDDVKPLQMTQQPSNYNQTLHSPVRTEQIPRALSPPPFPVQPPLPPPIHHVLPVRDVTPRRFPSRLLSDEPAITSITPLQSKRLTPRAPPVGSRAHNFDVEASLKKDEELEMLSREIQREREAIAMSLREHSKSSRSYAF